MQNLSPDLELNQTVAVTPEFYETLRLEQQTAALQEIRELSDFAFVFLDASNGDRDAAAELFEQSIDLLYEDGVFQMCRHRAVLAGIREGL
jgi:hypothetical protein